MRIVKVCLVLALTVLFSFPVAAAIVAGSAPGVPAMTEHTDFLPDLDGIGGWIVHGPPDGPISVAADPAAAPWEKMFSGFPAIPAGTGFSIHEVLVVAPDSPAWTDWHEEIITPGWVWGPGATVLIGGPTGTSYPLAGGGTPLIWSFFPPTPPGTVVEIWKEILCNTPGGCAGSITVLEHPTVPLPATVWLIAGALAALARRRRAASAIGGAVTARAACVR